VSESLRRGHQVVAVCRDASVYKLEAFANRAGFTVAAAPLVSDEAMLARALESCDAVAAVLITVRDLKATELVAPLAKAAATNEVKRLVFTAGEVTAMPEEGETVTPRQRFLYALGRVISWVSPYSIPCGIPITTAEC